MALTIKYSSKDIKGVGNFYKKRFIPASFFSCVLTLLGGCGSRTATKGIDRHPMAEKTLSHVDEKGVARMVDVTDKTPSLRVATARGRIRMERETLALIEEGKTPKGDVYSIARVAGIMAAKRTGDLIPMCHPLEITGADIVFRSDHKRGEIEIEATVRTWGKTGVEMEALTAVAVAALTIYDMCKAVDRDMTITDILLTTKSGGTRGPYKRKGI